MIHSKWDDTLTDGQDILKNVFDQVDSLKIYAEKSDTYVCNFLLSSDQYWKLQEYLKDSDEDHEPTQ